VSILDLKITDCMLFLDLPHNIWVHIFQNNWAQTCSLLFPSEIIRHLFTYNTMKAWSFSNLFKFPLQQRSPVSYIVIKENWWWFGAKESLNLWLQMNNPLKKSGYRSLVRWSFMKVPSLTTVIAAVLGFMLGTTFPISSFTKVLYIYIQYRERELNYVAT
jgi:hypothetical protein